MLMFSGLKISEIVIFCFGAKGRGLTATLSLARRVEELNGCLPAELAGMPKIQNSL